MTNGRREKARTEQNRTPRTKQAQCNCNQRYGGANGAIAHLTAMDEPGTGVYVVAEDVSESLGLVRRARFRRIDRDDAML